jgi:hypothetical protein
MGSPASTERRYNYIYKVIDGRDAAYYLVRVNTPGGGRLPSKIFSIGRYGEEGALERALEYRDALLKGRTTMPSLLAFSEDPADLTPDEIERIRLIFHFQKRHGEIKLSTIALLACLQEGELTRSRAAYPQISWISLCKYQPSRAGVAYCMSPPVSTSADSRGQQCL